MVRRSRNQIVLVLVQVLGPRRRERGRDVLQARRESVSTRWNLCGSLFLGTDQLRRLVEAGLL
jgi:hypothetical protein